MITRNSGWAICYEISDQEYIEIITGVDRRLCVYVIWKRELKIDIFNSTSHFDVRRRCSKWQSSVCIQACCRRVKELRNLPEIPDVRRMIQTENSRFEVSSAFYEGKQIVAD